MRIGILGTGNIGGGLGRLWAGLGHEVMFGSRAPEKAVRLAESVGHGARGGTFSDAALFGEVVVLAVPWPAAQDVIQAAGDLSGKVLIDCTNPVAEGMRLALGHTTSAAEEVARWAPGARVVKAFNTLGSKNLTNPRFNSDRASMFVCGDDQEAKEVVMRLGRVLDFDMVDCGPLESARLLEPLAMLWITLAYPIGMGPDIAFKLLRR
jgi:NADPH-dependent F420 reductase